jgi:hypothetical protein
MATVTQRIKEVKQPRGGYINPRDLEVIHLVSDSQLNENENIHPSLVGLAVDYLTRFVSGTSKDDSFRISILGAELIGEERYANKLLKNITGLNPMSVYSVCQLVGFDVCFRSGPAGYVPVQEILPDAATIENIIEMVERGKKFFSEYGPIMKDGFTLDGGYTKIIDKGDGDFLTSTTLWDFKVSINSPTSAHTLQLLIYYLMGKRSFLKDIFTPLQYLGVFNPRLNAIYRIPIQSISETIVAEVESQVIGY